MNLALIKTFLIFLTLSFSFTIDQSEIHSLTIKFRQQVNEGNMQMAEQTAESLLLHLEIDTNLVPQNFANKLNELASSAPIDIEQVKDIKNAIANGDYPIDIDRIADALMDVYRDMKS